MTRQPVKSSNVKSVGYDPVRGILEVEFKNGVYQYADVPPEMFAALLVADSIGRFVAQVVRADRKGARMAEEKDH